jgi:pSer/pThr/pTyr-binding forkhead associated (FHA) protein
VLKGRATQKSCTVRSVRIDLGRLREVTDEAQRVLRRNDVAFLDTPDELNQTVSRQHAHIAYAREAREFRLHDDNSTHGTRILRGSRIIEVPRGSSRGVKLQPGDEIVLGQAVVRFEPLPNRR